MMQNKKEKYLRQVVILNRNIIKITSLVSWIGSEKYLYVEGERCNVDIMYIHNIYVYTIIHYLTSTCKFHFYKYLASHDNKYKNIPAV